MFASVRSFALPIAAAALVIGFPTAGHAQADAKLDKTVVEFTIDVAEGVEGAGTVTRIVSGGTGNFAGFIGEQRQTFLGVNATGGANMRITFVLRKVVR